MSGRLLSRAIPSTARSGPPGKVARTRAQRDAEARAALAADMFAATAQGRALSSVAAPGSWSMDVPFTGGALTVAGSLPPEKPAKSAKARRPGRW